MRTLDLVLLASGSVRSQRTRSWLTALGIGVGIAAVVLLTSLGTGLQRYVLEQFTQFGTNLLQVSPGKSQTFGVSGAVLNTVRPLTLDDSGAIERLPHVQAVVPVVAGNAAVEAGGRTRRTAVYGVGVGMTTVWKFPVAMGRFLPDDEPTAARAFVVLGAKVHRELFGDTNALGELVRIGSERWRVVGVMESKGQFVGIDLDDAVYIPAARALDMFDREGLMEVDVLFDPGTPTDRVCEGIRSLLVARHGREDFTVTTQQQMLDVLGSVLDVLTFAVAALGGISLVVGGVGILTIMTIALQERTAEIGLLLALGATRRQLLALFLAEAAALSALGGLLGLVLGAGGARLLQLLVPGLPVATTLSHSVLAESVAVVIGLVAGTAPALQASRQDPIEALRAE